MFNQFIKQIRTAFAFLLLMMVITGVIYPGCMTLIGQVFFPFQANGSLLKKGDVTIGSRLIGQSFQSHQHFWGRPSATTSFPYNASHSGASNDGPLNEDLYKTIKERTQRFDHHKKIPADLVTASASGLDPEISPLAAYYQTPRLATSLHIPESELRLLVKQHIQPRSFGVLGEPRVNVLELNLALDKLITAHRKQ